MRKLVVSTMSAIALFAGTACSDAPPSPQGSEPTIPSTQNTALKIQERTPDRFVGEYHGEGVDAKFSSVKEGDAIEVKLEFNGILLKSLVKEGFDQQTGVNLADGSPAILTEMDRSAVKLVLAALEVEFSPPLDVKTKQEYDSVFSLTEVEKRFYKKLSNAWSQWPSTKSFDQKYDLKDEAFRADFEIYNIRRWATASTVAPNGFRSGTHDCNYCGRWATDCTDSAAIGGYFNGCNHAACGTDCGNSNTDYTNDCIDHDQCVRTSKHGGHVLASAWCSDEFSDAEDDFVGAASCAYVWRGTSTQGRCPTYWNGDGSCDCFCQFQDIDCGT